MRELLCYQIESRDKETGYWHVLRAIEPRFKRVEQMIVHHFLFSKREGIKTTVINTVEGTLNCRKEAMRLAYHYQNTHTDLRVTKTYQYSRRMGDYQSLKTVWENGVWKDC